MNNRLSLSLANLALAAGILSACGGGSSTPASVATASVSGTAATGAAIAAGTVTLKCVSGTATAATTGTDGSFTIDVTSVTLPCVGRVDYKDSGGAAQKLHTFITAVGTANITPVTELLVANLTSGTAADAFDKFDAAKAKAITSAQVSAAVTTVKNYLKTTLGVDVSNFPADPVGVKLVAKTGSTAGDAFDKVLDDLQAKLKSSGKKIADAVGDVGKLGNGGGASTGYPATASYTGKLSDGSACTVVVASDHSVTVSASNWAYPGSIKANLDGTYIPGGTGGEIAPAVFYAGQANFYEANAGDYGRASVSAPAYFVGLNFDASTGKLILASGNATTDGSSQFPAAGVNFGFVCAGEAFPSGAPIAGSGYNKAAVSQFKATNMVGNWNAPANVTVNNVSSLLACTIAVDSVGNVTLTSTNFAGGNLAAPYTSLDTYNGARNDVDNASYTLQSGPDTYVLILQKTSSARQVQVVINTSGSGVSSKGEKALTCSTANDPTAKWATLGRTLGGKTYTGVTDNNFNFKGGRGNTCSLNIAADGTTTYTDSTGASLTLSQNNTTAPTSNLSTQFDFLNGNFSLSFDGSTGTAQSGQVLGNRVFYSKSNTSTEYCLQLR